MHTSSTRRRRRPLLALIALLAVMGMTAAACGSDDSSDGGGNAAEVPDGPAIVIGAQDFPESVVLSELYAQGLAGAGYDVSVQDLGGYRDLLFGAFENGDVNFTLEYAASMLNFLTEGPAQPAGNDIDENIELVTPLLEEEGIAIAEPSDAIDTNAFVMTRAKAEELGIETLSDLAEKGADLRLGSPSDCEVNAFCLNGLQETYGLDMSANVVALDDGRVDALRGGSFDVAVLFSTDPSLTEDDLVVLEDDEGMLAADNIVPVMTQALVDAYGQDFVDRVNEISAALTTENVTQMNRAYVIDREDAASIAEQFLADNDLD
jgi:osmoprotectant transport system substrate-binding protein